MVTKTFLGVGLIGGAMAEAALSRGESVRIWNRSPQRCAALGEKGAQAFESAVEAAQGADSVHLALTADSAVDAVLESIASLDDRTLLIDHSTTSPEGTAARADRLSGAHKRFLHAPVFMSPDACRAAKGVMVVAGTQADYAEAEPILARMTGKLWYVGAAQKAAAATKLLGNAMILAMVGGFADVLNMADGMDLDRAHVGALFEQLDVSMVLKGRGQWMVQEDFDARWTLRMARKDLGLMLDGDSQGPLSILEALGAAMDQRIESGDGEKDVGVLGARRTP